MLAAVLVVPGAAF